MASADFCQVNHRLATVVVAVAGDTLTDLPG
jgi:hypothetical protein